MKPMISTHFMSDDAEFEFSPGCTLAEYSFSIRQAIEWFLGRGVSAFAATRGKKGEEHTLRIVALAQPQELIFSSLAPMEALAAEGYWPEDIAPERVWQPGARQARDGQNRVYSLEEETTLIQSRGLDLSVPMSVVAYGLGDQFVELFVTGATEVKCQGSTN